MDTRRSRANNFDSLRTLFSVLVLYSHAYPLLRGSNATEPLSLLTHGQANFGEIGVWSFFIISGFLITQSWLRAPEAVGFLRRRISRIYPGFIALSVVSALVFVPLATHFSPAPPISMLDILNVLRLQQTYEAVVFSNNPNQALNGSLWSIPYEFWCYIGVLALGLSGWLQKRHLLLALFVVALAWHLYVDITGWNPGGKLLGEIFGYPRFWATLLPFYLAGMLLQVYGGRALLRPWALAVAALVLVTSFWVPHAPVVALPTCGSYLLLGLSFTPRLHFLNLGKYGDFSYGVYLYAFPVEQFVVMALGTELSPWALFAIAAPVTLGCAALSWFLVERHFTGKKKKPAVAAAYL
jgi:peptidoglycan/LPS O-acetylase OafA/YrhL